MTTSIKEKHAVPPRASRMNQSQQQKIADLHVIPPDGNVSKAGRTRQAGIPAQPIPTTEPLPAEKQDRFHFLVYFGIGMLIVIVAIAVWNIIIVPTWQAVTDQWEYGNSRVFAIEADVGHGGVSTFLAFDLKGHITIVEVVESSPPTTHIYQSTAIMGTEAEKRVITIQIADLNANHKPDLIIHIEGMRQLLMLYNNGSTYQWTPPEQG